MKGRAAPSLLLAVLASGCVGPAGDIPSLQPRAAERIDPRLPVERPINDRPATSSLVTRLDSLVAQARGGEAGFEAAIALARRAAEGAGPPQSESWIVAQEALSGAIEARGPAASALGAIDSLGAEMLAAQGGMAPSDLAAVRAAAETVGAIDRRQSEAIAAIQARLGS